MEKSGLSLNNRLILLPRYVRHESGCRAQKPKKSPDIENKRISFSCHGTLRCNGQGPAITRLQSREEYGREETVESRVNRGKKVDQAQASLELVDMIMEVYLFSFSIHRNGRKRNWHLGILRPRQHGCLMVGGPQPGVEPKIGNVFLKSVLLRILCVSV